MHGLHGGFNDQRGLIESKEDRMSGNCIDYSCEGCVCFHFGLMYSEHSCDKGHQIEATRCDEYQSVKDLQADNKRLREALEAIIAMDDHDEMAARVADAVEEISD
jgi:hypothetical protein